MGFSINEKIFFLLSATKKKDLPKESSIKEIAFWGRSNVGKSSLLNSLTNSNIARTSKTPGRTTSINFFEIKNKIRLVDFPGYGYAKRSKIEIYDWNKLILEYLDSRKCLHTILLLIDSRHGLKKNDLEAIKLLEQLNTNVFIVLTKIDKISQNDLDTCYNNINQVTKTKIALNEKIFLTSSKENKGIIELKKIILAAM